MGLKHPFNSISHIVGGALAAGLMPILVVRASGPLAVAAVTVYGWSLLAMYTLSVLFHSISHERAEAWFFRLDQVGIYLLIAGTYTPVALLLVGGAPGWILFILEWTLGITGIILLLAVHRTPQWVHQTAYIVLGWAAVIMLPDLLAIPVGGFALLLGGGILYTAGSYLYNRNRPRLIGPLGDHEVWHILVIAGSMAHAAFVLGYVL